MTLVGDFGSEQVMTTLTRGTARSRLEAIWIKRAHREPMDPVQTARLVAAEGMEGGIAQRRQVTIIERETFERLPEAMRNAVDPSARRANLMISGVRLADTKGQVLKVGACRIRILGETKPCSRMDEVYPGLMQALIPDWGGGAWGQVLDNGQVTVGDRVSWVA